MNQAKKPRDVSEVCLTIKKAESTLYDQVEKRNYDAAMAQAEIIRLAADEMIVSLNCLRGKLVASATPMEIAMSSQAASAEQKKSIPAARWDAYNGDTQPIMTHAISVDDQRRSNGQIYIDIQPANQVGDETDISPSVTVEIQKLSDMLRAEGLTSLIDEEKDIDVPVFHLHLDNSDLAASFFHEPLSEGRSRFLMRLETGMEIESISKGVLTLSSIH